MKAKGRRFLSTKNMVILAVLFFMTCMVPSTVFASNSKIDVDGRVYKFGKDNKYNFSKSKKFKSTKDAKTYGSFMICGNVSDVTTKDDIPAYLISDGNLKLYYNHGDEMLLNESKDVWHLTEENGKTVDDIKFDNKILKGAIVLQTSTDRKNWVDVVKMTDAFNKKPVRTKSLYKTKSVQLINGCYYRLIVAYKLRIRTKDSNVLFIDTDKFKYKKCLELYEFYAYTDTGKENADSDVEGEKYTLGSRVRVKDFDSYSGETKISDDDAHFGWHLGEFFVNGYTSKVENSNDKKIVFLKNVGDKVTLWFRLDQNINKLNGNSKLSITSDGSGSDQYFEIPKMKFGRGTLIIRYTDSNNVKADPTIYTNYLEANTKVGVDTKVQLFEEGDYEVALDYEITEDELIDKIGHYRIFFEFSIRNGNCMVYPFDVVNGNELSNSSITENGFKLDLAKSRYLKVNIKKEILTDGENGFVEDTRFNGPAKDGAEYTEEGIYTITASNEYTGQSTEKKIYVGTDSVLKAYMTTGLSIPEINSLVEKGATISEDGIIQVESESDVIESVGEEPSTTKEKTNSNMWLYIIIGMIGLGVLGTLVVKKYKNDGGANK